VVTSRDPFLIFSLPNISLGWFKQETLNFVRWLAMWSFSLYRSTNSPSSGRDHCHVTCLNFGK